MDKKSLLELLRTNFPINDALYKTGRSIEDLALASGAQRVINFIETKIADAGLKGKVIT